MRQELLTWPTCLQPLRDERYIEAHPYRRPSHVHGKRFIVRNGGFIETYNSNPPYRVFLPWTVAHSVGSDTLMG